MNQKELAKALSISDDVITNLKQNGLEVSKKQLNAGFSTGISGGKSLITGEQAATLFKDVNKELAAKAAAKAAARAEKNKVAGKLFLAKNKTRKGVTTTKSGLQYKIIRAGKGKSPTTKDTVVTHYRGTLLDGTEFDSSVKSGPATFPVTGVIRGWIEALQLMKVGAKWRLFIPPDLAYGPNGSGRSIGPNATLIFEIELISIVAPKKKKSPKPPKSR